MNNKWIDVNKKLPKSGQEVLVYWYEEDLHQVHILSYFEEGDHFGVEDIDDLDQFSSKVERLLGGIFMKGREVEKTGFYIYSTNEKGYSKYRLHADIITYWMPLPMPPNDLLGDLGAIDIEDY